MKIGIINDKGGVGKTAIAQQMSIDLGLSVIELDPYGNLSSRISNTDFYQLHDKIELIDNCVVDFGGFAHPQEDTLLPSLDMVLIPYNPTVESVETTYNMLHRIKHIVDGITPILFIANRVTIKDKEAIESSFALFAKNLKHGASLVSIQDSKALVNAINGGYSVIEKSKSKGLVGYQNKKIASSFEELYLTIDKIFQGAKDV